MKASPAGHQSQVINEFVFCVAITKTRAQTCTNSFQGAIGDLEQALDRIRRCCPLASLVYSADSSLSIN